MRIAPLVLAIWLLAGCATPDIHLTQAEAMQFTIGKSTEAEIVGALGKPTSTTMAAGEKFLIYGDAGHRAKGSALFQLDEKGVLEDVTYTGSNGETRSGTNPSKTKVPISEI